MNYQEWDILQALCCSSEERSQRDLARESGCSLGIVNRSLQAFRDEGLVDEGYRPTEKALQMVVGNRTERAVILAAGYGMRMVPINAEMPKGMLTVSLTRSSPPVTLMKQSFSPSLAAWAR